MDADERTGPAQPDGHGLLDGAVVVPHAQRQLAHGLDCALPPFCSTFPLGFYRVAYTKLVRRLRGLHTYRSTSLQFILIHEP